MEEALGSLGTANTTTTPLMCPPQTLSWNIPGWHGSLSGQYVPLRVLPLHLPHCSFAGPAVALFFPGVPVGVRPTPLSLGWLPRRACVICPGKTGFVQKCALDNLQCLPPFFRCSTISKPAWGTPLGLTASSGYASPCVRCQNDEWPSLMRLNDEQRGPCLLRPVRRGPSARPWSDGLQTHRVPEFILCFTHG